jgi:hypothetical protein
VTVRGSFASKRGWGTVARDEFFYRVEGPTQTEEDAIMQVESGEIWGRPSRGSDIPSVKAYRGKLPPGKRGVQFTTPIQPDRGSGTPYEARWYYPQTPGVELRTGEDGEDYAVIPADVENFQR